MIVDDSITYGENLRFFFANGFPWVLFGVTLIVFSVIAWQVLKSSGVFLKLLFSFVLTGVVSAAVAFITPGIIGDAYKDEKVALQVNAGYGFDPDDSFVNRFTVRQLYKFSGEVVNLSQVEQGNRSSFGSPKRPAPGEVLFGLLDESGDKSRITLYTSESGGVDVDDLVELELVK